MFHAFEMFHDSHNVPSDRLVSFLLSFDNMFYVGNDASRSYFWMHAEHNQNVLSSCRIIQQLVNGIIAPAAVPNIGVGPW